MMIAKPTTASAAATVMTKNTNSWPSMPTYLENATNVRLTAFSWELDAQKHDDHVSANDYTESSDHEDHPGQNERLGQHRQGAFFARTSAPTMATRSRIPVSSNGTT